MEKKTIVFRIFLFIVMALLLILANSNRVKNTKLFAKDSLETIYLGYNLASGNGHSLDGETPSYLREPFISVINALNIFRLSPQSKSISKEDLVSNEKMVLKMTELNLVYLAIIFVCLWFLAEKLNMSRVFIALAAIIPVLFFATFTTYITSVNSELPTAILLLLLTILLMKFVRNKNIYVGISIGITFGFLALTKAVFLYIFITFIPIWILLEYILVNEGRKHSMKIISIVSLTFAMIISPWMLRNNYYFDHFSITERGGQVLMMRAVHNQMSNDEILGGFYVYGPVFLQRNLFERYLGYQKSDIAYGGRFQGLNRSLPEDSLAIMEGRYEDIKSYYRMAQNNYIKKFAKPKEQDNDLVNEKVFLDQAKSMILNDLLSHSKTSFLFAWRGIWFYGGQHFIPVFLTFFMVISMPILLFYGFYTKNKTVILIVLASFLYYLFHTFLTHFIPRYTGPLIPILSIFLMFILNKLSLSLKSKFIRNNA